MTWQILAGAACGMASVAVSEAVLGLGPAMLKRSLFQSLAAGATLRTIWVLLLTVWAMGSASVDVRAFLPALMVGYLAAQVFEGVRYTRYFEQC